MAQNYLPLDISIPRARPLIDPFNFQVGYGRPPYYLGRQADPVGVLNNNVSITTPTQTTTTSLFQNKTMTYVLIGGVVLLILMRPINRY